jgi:hypothetical protein
MNISTVIQSIESAYQTAFTGKTLYLQLAPATALPLYVVLRLGSITPNEPDLVNRDWSMNGTFYLFDTSDTAIIADVEAITSAYDRNAAMSGIYSSLVQSVDIDVNYTDQGALWNASVSVEFRWSS